MRHWWLYGALVLVVLGTVVASGGFSATSSDRDVRVPVTADEHSLLALEVIETGGTAGTPVALLRVTDYFEQDVDLDALAVDAPTGNVTLVDPGPRPVDESTVVVLRCDGTTDGPVPVTVHIAASGPGVNVELSRTTSMDCRPRPGQSAEASPTTPSG